MFQGLWVEKYRPQTLNDIVLTDRIKQEIVKFKEQKEIPHLLFLSTPGQGKTSLAKIIVKDILDCVYLYINASDENGIDTIRTKIIGFAQTKSIDGKLKVIILDEADGLTPVAQQALRNVMEEYAGNVRFIITANYEFKIIAAIRSRCQTFDNLNPPIEGVVRRVTEILKAEKVSVEAEQKPKLIDLIRTNYPDIRKIISVISKNVINGKLDIQAQQIGLDFAQGILKQIQEGTDPTAIRRHIIENDMKYNKDYHALMKDLFNAVDHSEIDVIQKRKMMIILAEHMYRHTFVMDPEINCYACVIALAE